ncbi:hypothetical protein Cst_c19020 [Thermoclostridium stercorarium subsp. stercorarium DSM 8532]|uniref:Uncharacterized protein n=1 Tax=Thermoclostridium stercorarium (strain ATCC 35414 / DSM 8532 / NCIMB 11754) TaxID=1121335 RepID=L7VQA1_THES1|nr:hypothetical protein Cst_c19020 [Thermoclostridium stercorarium subsp. stercorarium DSM 8532]
MYGMCYQNIFRLHKYFKRYTKRHPCEEIIQKEQEALRNDLLKTGIPNLKKFSSLLDYKV